MDPRVKHEDDEMGTVLRPPAPWGIGRPQTMSALPLREERPRMARWGTAGPRLGFHAPVSRWGRFRHRRPARGAAHNPLILHESYRCMGLNRALNPGTRPGPAIFW